MSALIDGTNRGAGICEEDPSFKDGEVTFEFTANREGKIRYGDGISKHNRYIPMLLPKLYYIDAQRDLENFEEDLLLMQEDDLVKRMRAGNCMFDMGKSAIIVSPVSG